MNLKDQMTFQYIYPKYKKLISETIKVYKNTLGFNFPHNDMRLDLMTRLMGTDILESIYILNYLHKSIELNGDVCEFGVAQGATSALIANEIVDTDKNLWLFDSFQGLPEPTDKDTLKNDIFNLGSMKAYKGTMACGEKEVIERLNEIRFPLDRRRVIPGFIEETLKNADIKNVCFSYIDLDLYEPISITLKYIDNSLSVNGYMIVDDYDFFSTGVKTAVDEFINERDYYEIEILPGFCVLKKIK